MNFNTKKIEEIMAVVDSLDEITGAETSQEYIEILEAVQELISARIDVARHVQAEIAEQSAGVPS